MKNFFSSLGNILNKQYAVPFEGRFSLVLKAFSDREKQIFFSAMGVLAGTAIVLLLMINHAFIIQIPARGGTLIEGTLNTPAHINPLLATGEIGSEADRDLSALIYSGLLRAQSSGGYIPDLAESYEIADGGRSYVFRLKEGLTWHDREKITADDVVFTIKTAQDSRMKSPKRASWDGVGVEKVDERTIRFTLAKPYAPFLENMTMGILPEHIWGTVDVNRFDTSKYNREPIGSGPYHVDSIKTTTKDNEEIPISYTLKAFKNFSLGTPYISTITFVFARNEEELLSLLEKGTIDSVNSISHEKGKLLAQQGYRIEHTPLPRVLAVFFNQNEAPLFADTAVRSALIESIDKQGLIDTALAGYGTPLNSFFPSATVEHRVISSEKAPIDRIASARTILEKAGWKFDEETKLWTKKNKKESQTLRFSLSTSEASELKTVTQELKNTWELLGIPVDVRIFATGDFKETVVRPRKFDALFFGQVLGRDSDPYPFWHSSQRIDPGLNITSYANSRVDKILEDARAETNIEKRQTLYQDFKKELARDIPGIPLYAPEFLYVVPEKVHGISLGTITIPAERFLNVHEWYIKTEGVWKIFAKE